MTNEEAANLLGVTTKTVFRLIESGDLVRVARGVVDRASVERYLANRQGGRKRVWSERTAWGALALLSGMSAEWLGSVQASRLRSTLRKIDTEDLITRLRDRATTRSYSGHQSVATLLRNDPRIVLVDTTVLGLVADSTRTDAYLHATTLDAITHRLGLREAVTGATTLRATGFDLDLVRTIAKYGTAVAAVDAAASLDPRTRGLGEAALAQNLERMRT